MSAGFEYFNPPFEKSGLSRDLIWGSLDLLVHLRLLNLRGAFKSVFAFLILLEGGKWQHKAPLVYINNLAANREPAVLL